MNAVATRRALLTSRGIHLSATLSSPYRSSQPPSLLPSLASLSSRSLSKATIRHNSSSPIKPQEQQKKSRSDSQHSQQNGNPELPSFSLEALGLSKNMRLVVIGLISVYGCFESWFWYKAFLRWYNGEEEEKTA